jgi:hypothetical protein
VKNLRILGLILGGLSGALFVLAVIVRMTLEIGTARPYVESIGAGAVSNVVLGSALLCLLVGGGCLAVSTIRRSRQRTARHRRNAERIQRLEQAALTEKHSAAIPAQESSSAMATAASPAEVEEAGAPSLDLSSAPEVLAPTGDAAPATEIYVPLTLAVAALLLILSLQTGNLLGQRTSLRVEREAQAAPLHSTQQVQAQLQSLLTGTAQIAADGNAAARAILNDLRAQGVGVVPK